MTAMQKHNHVMNFTPALVRTSLPNLTFISFLLAKNEFKYFVITMEGVGSLVVFDPSLVLLKLV